MAEYVTNWGVSDNTKIDSLEELIKQLRAELEKEQVEKKEINDEKNRLIKEKDEVSVAPGGRICN